MSIAFWVKRRSELGRVRTRGLKKKKKRAVDSNREITIRAKVSLSFWVKRRSELRRVRTIGLKKR